MVLIPVQIGLPDLVVREAAVSTRYAPPSERTLALLSWTMQYALRLGAVAATGLVAVFALSSGIRGGTVMVLALAPVLLLAPRMNIAASALRTLGWPIAGQLPDKVIRPGTIIVVFATLLLFLPSPRIKAEWIAAATMVGYITAWGMGELMLRRRLSSSPRDGGNYMLARPDRRNLFVTAISLGAITAGSSSQHNVDFVALGVFSSDAEIGIYRIATTLGSIGIAALLAVNMVAGPRIAATRTALDLRANLGGIVGQAALVSMLVSGVFALIIVVAGKLVLTLLYGADFAAAAAPLAIIALGQLASSAIGPVALTLSMLGHERSVLKAMAATMLLKLVLVGFLVPQFGAAGAAMSSAVNLLAWNLVLWLRARAVLGIDTSAIGGLRNAFRKA